MAAQLLKYFDEAKKISGLKGQMRMAVLTGLPSTKAGSEPDSAELVKKFHDALETIRKEA